MRTTRASAKSLRLICLSFRHALIPAGGESAGAWVVRADGLRPAPSPGAVGVVADALLGMRGARSGSPDGAADGVSKGKGERVRCG